MQPVDLPPPPAKPATATTTTTTTVKTPPATTTTTAADFTDIELTSMRSVIANRLTLSKVCSCSSISCSNNYYNQYSFTLYRGGKCHHQ